MNQTQQEEIEVLKSMYLNDFQDMTQETPHFKIQIEGKSKKTPKLQRILHGSEIG
jgi:hypothetical protein